MSRHNISEYDMLRVERKLNNVLSEKLSSRVETYTQQKIKNLHNLLDECEKEDSTQNLSYTSDAPHSNPSPSPTPPVTQRHLQPTSQYHHQNSLPSQPQSDFLANQKKYLTQVSETKSTIANLRLEVKTSQSTIQSLKQFLTQEKSQHALQMAQATQEKEKISLDLEEQYSGSIQRQQGLIERLLEDKKE